jgi:hypothetical protein
VSGRPAIKAGIAYFATVFLAGFVLGTVRVLFLIPRMSEAAAVLIELPIMLTLSWVVARWLIARLGVPAVMTARVTMGGLAFALLMIAELGVSVFLLDRSLIEHLNHYTELSALLGLAGQIAFAAIPAAQLAARR